MLLTVCRKHSILIINRLKVWKCFPSCVTSTKKVRNRSPFFCISPYFQTCVPWKRKKSRSSSSSIVPIGCVFLAGKRNLATRERTWRVTLHINVKSVRKFFSSNVEDSRRNHNNFKTQKVTVWNHFEILCS